MDSLFSFDVFRFAFSTISQPFLGYFLHLRSFSPLLQKFVDEFDYRKGLIADKMLYGLDLAPEFSVSGRSRGGRGIVRTENTEFLYLRSEICDDSVYLTGFIKRVDKLEKLGLIKSFLPSDVAPMYNYQDSRHQSGTSYGLYELGKGEKSVVWYWELDLEKRCYHEFKTINFAEAMGVYTAQKDKM